MEDGHKLTWGNVRNLKI